jgi:TP901 family phage tail tape measure protein
MTEDFEVGEFRVDVVADTGDLQKQLAGIGDTAARAGRETSATMRPAARDVEVFGDRVRGVSTMLAGLLAMIVSTGTNAWRGMLGFIGRTTAGLIDLSAVGLLQVSRGMRTVAESTRDANGQLSTTGKVAIVASEGLEKIAQTALIVSGVITGLQIAAATAFAAIVVAAHRAAADFEPAWNRVLTVLGRTGGEFHALRGQVSNMAGGIGADAKEAAAALYEILGAMPQLTGAPQRSLKLLEESLEAGATGFTETAEAAAAATGVLNAFGMEVERSTEVMDALWAAQDAGKFTLGQIAQEIGPAAATIAALGGSYKDLLAILAVTTPLNIPVPEAVTQVESAIGSLLNQGPQAQAAMKELGITIDANSVRTKGLAGALLEVIEATQGNPETLRRFFPDREGLSLMIQLSQRTDELRARIDDVSNSQGRHREVVDQMNNSWERQKEILGQHIPTTLRGLGFEFEGLGVKALRVINRIAFALRGLDAQGRRIELPQTAWTRMEDAVRGEEARRREVEERLRGAFAARAAARTAAPQPSPFNPTAYLFGDQLTKPRVAPEVATLDASRKKVDELRTSLEAAATVALAASGDYGTYEKAVENTRQRVNALVLAEMRRLEAAGVQKSEIAALAELYQADASGYRKAQQQRQAASRKATEELKRDQEELERARDRHATALDRQVEQLRKWADTAEALKQNGLAEQLRQEARELALYGTTLGQWADQLRAVISGVQTLDRSGRSRLFDPDRLADPFGAALKDVQPQLEALTLTYETAMSEAQERLAAKAVSRDDFEDAGRAAAEKFNAGLFEFLEQLEADDVIPPQVLNEVRARFKNTEGEPDKKQDPADQAREYGTLARAVLQAADAFGNLDEGIRSALEAAISLAETIGSIDFSKVRVKEMPSGERVAYGGLSVAGTAALVSGMAGLAAAFVEWGQRRREAELALIQQIARNSRALEAFREKELRDVSPADRDALLTQAAAFEKRWGESIRNMQAVGYQSGYMNGLTPQQVEFLNRLEEITGGEFFDQKTGRLQFEGFREALEAFRSGELGGFGDDLQGEMDRLAFLFAGAGDAIGDATDRMAAFLETVRKFSPDFAAELERVLKEQGPEAARAWLEAQVLAYGQGGVGAVSGLFGAGLTAEDIERILAAARERVDEVEKGATAGAESTSYQNVKTITEQTGHRLYGALVTLVFLVRAIYSFLTGKPFEVPVVVEPAVPAGPSTPPTGGPDPIPGGSAGDPPGAGAGGGSRPVEPPVNVGDAAALSVVPTLSVGRLVVDSLTLPDLALAGPPAAPRYGAADRLELAPAGVEGDGGQFFGDVYVTVEASFAGSAPGVSFKDAGQQIGQSIRKELTVDGIDRALGRKVRDIRRARGGRPTS